MIQYIKYKEERLPVRISYYALKMFKKETGIDFQEMEDKSQDLEYYEPLIYYSLVSGAKAGEKEFTIKKGDEDVPVKRDDEVLEDILDECWMEFVKLIPLFFPEVEGVEKKPTRAERREQDRKDKKA